MCFEALEARQVLSGMSPTTETLDFYVTGGTAPQVEDDTAETLVGEKVIVDVLANDSDADDDLLRTSLAIVSSQRPSHGTVSINPVTQKIEYTPFSGFAGIDTFRYTVQDRAGNVSSEALVTITVKAIPVAVNDTVTADYGDTAAIEIDVLANDTDADTDDGGIDLSTSTVQIVSGTGQLLHGTAEYIPATGKIRYTPTTGYYLTDTFSYTVTDKDGHVSNEATVTIQVLPEAQPQDQKILADKGEELTIDLVGGATDPNGIAMTFRIVTSPTKGHWYDNGDGTILYTPDTQFTGTDTFTYQLIDSDGNKSGEATVTITYIEHKAVDLLKLAGQNPSTGDKWYHLETTHAGKLSVEAIYNLSGGNITMTLYAMDDRSAAPSLDDPGLKERQFQNNRVDWTVAGAGEHYYLKVSGTNSNVTLNLANVFNPNGATAVIYGTDDNDTVEIAPTFVTVTDATEGFSIKYKLDVPRTVEFDGGDGTNTVIINGSDSDDTVDVTRDPTAKTVTVTGLSFEPVLTNVKNITFAGGKGDDTIQLHGTSDKETFTNSSSGLRWVAEAEKCTMTINSFETINVDTDDKDDVAYLAGSQEDDELIATPTTVTLKYGDDYQVVLTGFTTVTATAVHGAYDHDTATFTGDAGNDVFVANAATNEAIFSRDEDSQAEGQWKLTVSGFDEVVATAGEGGEDRVTFNDSYGDDKLEGTVAQAHFTNNGVDFLAKGFLTIEATASRGGDDTVKLLGADHKPDPDQETTIPDEFDISIDNGKVSAKLKLASDADESATTYTLSGFGTISADGGSGSDKLTLHDTKGKDTLTLGPDGGDFEGSTFSIHFENFETTPGSEGDTNRLVFDFSTYPDDGDEVVFVDSTGDDTFRAGAEWASFVVPDYRYEVSGFRTITATSSAGGEDRAYFEDTKDDDTFNASPTRASMAGLFNDHAYSITATGFAEVTATSENGGEDTAILKGSTGNDTANVQYSAVISGNADGKSFRNKVYGFKNVQFTAEGGDDYFKVWDTDKDDTLTAKPTQIVYSNEMFTATGTGFDHLVAQKFDQNTGQRPDDGGGYTESDYNNNDVANLYDTTGNDTLTGSEGAANIKFTGTSQDRTTSIDYDINVIAFPTVNVYAGSGSSDKDVAMLEDSSGNDTFVGNSAEASLSGKLAGKKYKITVSRFDEVTVEKKNGGNDIAKLTDSVGDDTFTGKPTEASLKGTGYLLTVKAFDEVFGYATNGGTDTAELFGSAGSDIFTGRDSKSTMTGSGFSLTAEKFEKVIAHGGGGNDTANLYDYIYNEYLQAKKAKTILSGHFKDGPAFSYEVDDFDTVNAYQTQGNDRYTREETLDYVFNLFGTWSRS